MREQEDEVTEGNINGEGRVIMRTRRQSQKETIIEKGEG